MGSAACSPAIAACDRPRLLNRVLPRAFVAVDPEPVDRHALHQLQQQLGSDTTGGWLAPDDLHLTVRFLGDLDEAAADQLAIRCAALAAATPASTAWSTGLEAWPSDRPHLLVLGFAVAPALGGLQQALQALPGPWPADHRPWRPHLTLRRAPIGNAPLLPGSPPPSLALACRHLTLFARAAAGARRRYRRLASWPLQASPLAGE